MEQRKKLGNFFESLKARPPKTASDSLKNEKIN